MGAGCQQDKSTESEDGEGCHVEINDSVLRVDGVSMVWGRCPRREGRTCYIIIFRSLSGLIVHEIEVGILEQYSNLKFEG